MTAHPAVLGIQLFKVVSWGHGKSDGANSYDGAAAPSAQGSPKDGYLEQRIQP